MKRNDPCNQPTQSQTRNNGRPSTDLSRISEQNRSKIEPIKPCMNDLKDKSQLSTTKNFKNKEKNKKTF